MVYVLFIEGSEINNLRLDVSRTKKDIKKDLFMSFQLFLIWIQFSKMDPQFY